MDSKQNDRIAEAMATLEDGIRNLTSTEAWTRYLRMQSVLHEYSFCNTMLILASRPDATRVAGIHAWNKLGRHVMKGEKAIFILAPTFAKKTDDKDRQHDEAKTERKPVFFRTAAVFDVAQTGGEPLPEPVRKLTGDASGDLFNRLAVFSIEHGCPVTVEPIAGGANGFYSPAEHRITIAEGLAPDQAAKTLAHEIAHSSLHRDIEVYRAHRGDDELEAESVSYVVLNRFPVD